MGREDTGLTFEQRRTNMGKQQDKRIELAKRILDTTDKATLDAVEIALFGPAPIKFTKKEIEEMEEQVDRIRNGDDRSYTWAEVKRSAIRELRNELPAHPFPQSETGCCSFCQVVRRTTFWLGQ